MVAAIRPSWAQLLHLGGRLDIDKLRITCPKRNSRLQTGWEGFFPYYAGYPEAFARTLLESARLKAGAVVLDPWNGSGTTTYTAAQLGLTARGCDLNPVMVIVARARLLSPHEADSLDPLAHRIVRCAKTPTKDPGSDDPLTWWFTANTTKVLRAIERSIRRHLVGQQTLTAAGTNLDRMSGIAATFYVALFSVCRDLAFRFQASNPTWMRRPGGNELKVWASRTSIVERFTANLREMAAALMERTTQGSLLAPEPGGYDIRLTDTATNPLASNSVDLILTSPPYCTRIDYTAATRIELAVLAPLLNTSWQELGRQMIGSTRVPLHDLVPDDSWGPTCRAFMKALYRHPSKASKGYYYKTHLDYFEKMGRSLTNLSGAMRKSAVAVLVVQDSFYKEMHNDLPTIIAEMAEPRGLQLCRREDFYIARSMSGINPRSRFYERGKGATEAVLCFKRS